MQPAFHRSALELVAVHVRTAVDRLLARWSRCEGQVVDVDEAMMHVALEVVGSSLFGADLSGDAERLADATLAALDVVVRKARSPLQIPVAIPTPTNVVLRRAVARLDAAVDTMLAERETRPLPAGAAPRDMLDLLLAAAGRRRDATVPTPGARPGRHVHRGRARDGRERADVGLAPARPRTRRRSRGCAWRSTPSAPGGTPSFEDVAALPWTSAVLDETLRLFPPAWLITRRSLAADVLAGVEVPPGSLMIVSPWLVHRHAGAWSEPDRFDPARFLDASGDRRRDVAASSAYLPFGAGPRLCIGRDMALLEGVLVLASLAARVDLERVGPPPRAVPLVTIRPADGLPMRVRARG